MLRVRAFQGLIPRRELAARIACVPYDVVNREEAAALAAGNPHSLLHVDRAEIDLPPETDPYSDIVYATARKNFERMQNAGWLERESSPALYIYRQQMGGHTQTGIAGVCHIDDYASDVIRKHEKTRKDKEDDRTRLISTIRANTGPVFLTYRGRPEIARLAGAAASGPALFDFTAEDGVRHTVWRAPDPAALEEAFQAVPAAYVADGHHRSASAARVGMEFRAARAGAASAGESDWFLAVLFPAEELQILPYHRVVADLRGHSPEEFLAKVKSIFEVSEDAGPKPPGPGSACMYLAGRWHLLRWRAEESAPPSAKLDVSILQERLLAPVLGIEDPRTDKRIDFVGGIRGTGELERRVNGGEAAVAFSMSPVTVEQLMSLSDAGEIMPPKSTWFEPKLRSGLFIHTFGS